jgi:hypothetical protein
MWYSVAPRTNIKKTCVFKEIGFCAQNMIIVLDSIVNIIRGTRVEALITDHLRDLAPNLEKYKVVQIFHV